MLQDESKSFFCRVFYDFQFSFQVVTRWLPDNGILSCVEDVICNIRIERSNVCNSILNQFPSLYSTSTINSSRLYIQ